MEIALSGKTENEKRAAEKAGAERTAGERACRADAIRKEGAKCEPCPEPRRNWERADRIRRMIQPWARLQCQDCTAIPQIDILKNLVAVTGNPYSPPLAF